MLYFIGFYDEIKCTRYYPFIGRNKRYKFLLMKINEILSDRKKIISNTFFISQINHFSDEILLRSVRDIFLFS